MLFGSFYIDFCFVKNVGYVRIVKLNVVKRHKYCRMSGNNLTQHLKGNSCPHQCREACDSQAMRDKDGTVWLGAFLIHVVASYYLSVVTHRIETILKLQH